MTTALRRYVRQAPARYPLLLAAYLGHVNAQNRQRYTRMSATRFAKAYGETEPGLMRLASASRTIGMRPSPAQSAYADCKSPAPKNSFRALSAPIPSVPALARRKRRR